MTIKYYTKQVYGKDTFYFTEDNNATQAIQRLTGRKTLTQNDANSLHYLGIEFQETYTEHTQEFYDRLGNHPKTSII